MSSHPTIEDYVAAVQDPENAFRTPSLRRAVFALHPVWGIPSPASGNAAVVFKATVDGVDQALRFFIREDASDGLRYGALARHFAEHGLLDCVAGVHWIDDAVEVGGRTWPMVQMEWIEGRTLEVHVGDLARNGDVGALHALAGRWREQLRRLQEADFAHGDLQHGNVLVQPSSTLRLVDFDGSWITPFAGWPAPAETGQPNYQRTGRTWGRWMDTFPGLVVYTSLLALSRRPDAWRTLHTGENLLLSSDDFARVDGTAAWHLLRSIEDPEVAHVVGRLRWCCAPDWDADGPLEALLDRERVVGGGRAEPPPPPVFRLSPGGARDEWWTPPPRVPPPGSGTSQGWAAADEDGPLFTGVSASPGPVGGAPTTGSATAPTPPAPTPASPATPAPVPPRRVPAAAVAAAVTALLLFILVVPTDPGSAFAVALIGGLVAFLVARAVTRRRE
ncbi:hypothetical protein [Geodermatophilus maliterrae]|uniref:Aminoglycoside phosphotransferase domain-containing protein n=1 Tax=Geodermatophilus maliterrae TaxID=3162531 RepID=A0ABV3X981_9ACTN